MSGFHEVRFPDNIAYGATGGPSSRRRSLSPAPGTGEKVVEVEDFVDFLRQCEEQRQLAKTMTSASEGAFAKVWDNPDDAEHDRL